MKKPNFPTDKIIQTVCFGCGNKFGKPKGGTVGAWVDTCDICGEKGVTCASAPHDFGIYSTPEIEEADKEQRRI